MKQMHTSWDSNRSATIASSLIGVGDGYVTLGDHTFPVEKGQEQLAASDLVASLAASIRMFRSAHIRLPRDT